MVKPKSFHLQWHITEKCNFKCKHCYTEKPMNELSTDELFLILDQYIEMIKRWKMDINNRPRLLSISGGEPLLRKDIFELLEAINENKDMFTNVVLMSNGSTITDNVIKKLKDLGIPQIQISLDGLEKNNEGDFVFSNWPGRIFIHRNGKNIKLYDTTAEELNTADLDYDLKHNLILVPTFFDNRIIAFKIVD